MCMHGPGDASSASPQVGFFGGVRISTGPFFSFCFFSPVARCDKIVFYVLKSPDYLSFFVLMVSAKRDLAREVWRRSDLDDVTRLMTLGVT